MARRWQALSLAEREGHKGQAEAMLRDVLAHREDRKVFQALAGILQDQGRWAELEPLYRSRVEAGDRSYLERLGHSICAQDGREDEGETWLRAAIAENQDAPLALLNLGASAKRHGRPNEAVRHFERAIELGESRAVVELADVLEGGPRDRDVDGLYRQAIRNGHRSAPAHLARRLWTRGELDELESLYRLAIERGHGPAPAAELGCIIRMHEPHRRDDAGSLIDRALDEGIRWQVLEQIARLRTVSPDAAIWMLGRGLRHARTLDPTRACGTPDFLDSMLAEMIGILSKEQRYAEANDFVPGVLASTASGHALMAVIRLLESQRRWDEVETICRKSVEAGDPSYAERLGHSIFMHRNRDDEAETILRGAVTGNNNAGSALMILGALAKRNDRCADAAEYFEMAQKLGEKRAFAELAGLRNIGLRDGRVEAATRLPAQFNHGETLSDRRRAADEMWHRALNAGRRGHPEDELALYEQLTQLFGDDLDPRLHRLTTRAMCKRASVLGKSGQLEAALAIYSDAIQGVPDEPTVEPRYRIARALSGKAYLLRSIGRSDQALESYDAIIDRFWEDPDVVLRREAGVAGESKAHLLGQTGRLGDADAAYRHVVDAFGDEPDQQLTLLVARALLACGGLGPAIGSRGVSAIAERADAACAMIEADAPNNARVLHDHARIVAELIGDPERATQLFAQAVRTDPSDANILANFARLRLETGAIAEGIVLAEEALVTSREDDREVIAEVSLYLLALGSPDRHPVSFETLRRLIPTGVRSPGWDFNRVLSRARDAGQAHPMIDVLADVISCRRDSQDLHEWPAWQEASPGAILHAQAEQAAAAVCCSFCDRSRHQIDKMIQGPGVWICDTCLGLRAEHVSIGQPATTVESGADAYDKPANTPRDASSSVSVSVREDEAFCSFCAKAAREVKRLVGEPLGAWICNECIAAGLQSLTEGAK